MIQNGSRVSPNERPHDIHVNGQPLERNGREKRQRAMGGAPMLRPPLSQFETLMEWAESRAVVVPPYLRNDFIAASVAPTSTTVMPQAKPSPGNDDDDSECGDEQLGLSPLKPHDDDEVGDEYPYNDEWQSEPGGDEYFM